MAKSLKKTTIKKATTRSRKVSEPLDEIIEETFDGDFEMTEDASSTSKKKIIIFAVILLVVIGLLYTFKSVFVAAMVNSKPISRLKLVSELEKRSGKDVLESLITENLINDEAQKQNIQISKDDLNKEISKIEENLKAQGQTLDQVLVTQGMTRQDLEKQIRFQKIIEKILEKDTVVTDVEITDYIKADKTTYPKGTATDAEKVGIAEQLKQQKLSEKFQSWLEELRTKAKINYFLQ